METLEDKPASRRGRIWARISGPNRFMHRWWFPRWKCLSGAEKWPRRWWFPPSSRRDDVPHKPEAAHEKVSETIRLTMLSLLGFALFCLLITWGVPDTALLVADPMIQVPFADMPISFRSFLIVGPLLLMVMTLYLHIFYGYWLVHKTHAHPPTLFSLDHPAAPSLTAFIFYWLPSLVLIVMTWKAGVNIDCGVSLAILTCVVTATLVFLGIRRCPASQRKRTVVCPPGHPDVYRGSRRLLPRRAPLAARLIVHLTMPTP